MHTRPRHFSSTPVKRSFVSTVYALSFSPGKSVLSLLDVMSAMTESSSDMPVTILRKFSGAQLDHGTRLES